MHTRHFQNGCGERWAVGRHGRWRHHERHGGGGRHGRGDDETMRAGRMLAHGDLRLIALALIAEEPRHGYEIIKQLEDRTEGWYAPSPGVVYPTLTYLEEAGYVTGAADGAKKLYTITDEGRSYLEQNRSFVDAVLDRLKAVGERVRERRRERNEVEGSSGDSSMPRSIQGAFQDLSEVVREALRHDRDAIVRVIETLDRATNELRRKS
jgi:DNA-binding PadR family transcriptional regulator